MTTLLEDGDAVLRVEVTRTGIPIEALPFLFNRYYRIDQSPARLVDDLRRSGSGLGPAICRSIVSAHQGPHKVSSHVVKGNQFEMRIPIQQEKYWQIRLRINLGI